MKKQNNILYATIKIVVCFMLTGTILSACTEEILYNTENIVEGVPTEINIQMGVSDMDRITTRGLSEDGEYQVNNLYILVFDANTKQKKTGKYYTDDELTVITAGSRTGTLKLKTTSGESLIFGVANVDGELEGGSMKLLEKLEKIQKLQDLQDISVELNTAGSIDRSTAALTMSGAYVATDGIQDEDGYCIIPETVSTLKGKISLKRLDSHITFKIKPLMENVTYTINGKQITGKIKSFTPTSWQVYNVPSKSYIMERDVTISKGRDAASAAKDYNTSREFIRFDDDKTDKNARVFDFYMLENRKDSKGEIKNYNQREIELKNSDKTNSGVYEYVEEYATYVKIKAHLEIANPNNDNGIRVADVTYVVHLGYVNNDPTDFKNYRNKKYTYNLQIEDVENIKLEVTDKVENQPGAEGDIVDSQTTVYNIDAHYNYLILGFKYSEVENGLKFIVKTPFAETTNASTNNKELCDYKWIRFKRNTENKESILEKFPETSKQKALIDLFGLEDDIKAQYNNDRNVDKTYYYTVFVDEYYYDTPPAGKSWKEPYWPNFVNKENRYAMLLFSPQYSDDKESSYAGAKYMITQKSIETYYSTSKLNPSNNIGLGMEHIDENGVPNLWQGGRGDDINNGYKNTWKSFTTSKYWSTYTNLTIPSNNTFEMSPNNQGAIYQCLSRNRDENGDGIITGNEIKWYLPATQQLVGMFLGAESLPTPLFSKTNSGPTYDTFNRTKGTYHYITSDRRRIWSEEGASYGPDYVNYATSPEKLRCVRTLGVDAQYQADNYTTDIIGKIYTYNSSIRTFYVSYMDERCMRDSYFEKRELDSHHNFDPINSPYKAFQVAKQPMALSTNGKEPKQNTYYLTTWSKLVDIDSSHNSVCKYYTEETNSKDKGTWRTPNQRELMIINMENPTDIQYTETGAYSKTAWKFNSTHHFGVSATQLYKDSNAAGGSFIRCVRDIKQD